MKSQVYIAAAAAAFGLADAQCNANNCARAVTGTRHGPATQALRRADCSSYQRTTYTIFSNTESIILTTLSSTFTRTVAPTTVTVTTTVTPFVLPTVTIDFPEPPVITAFSEPERRDLGDLDARQLVPSFKPIPFYASACDGSLAYKSACSCWGITATATFITLPGTTTVSRTSYDYDYITIVDTTGITTTTLRITSTPSVSASSSDEASPSQTISSLEPSVTSERSSFIPTDEPTFTSSEEPSATQTDDEASSTQTEEPSATETDEPTSSADESSSITTPPTTLVTSVVSATSEDSSSTADESSDGGIVITLPSPLPTLTII
ncbi:hypothetical protein CkaCkLH20_05412 [Colletotrichum karsti]|uniref:Uncharacterized protein n=1 Tax=Colletotrichum karsti TaxID=1095194 RepID=A0A9P6IAT5_9PEZI|nr:uncharacterized protein CkaCkLH20_05412 [Colletotrichum karsti]KAF9877146.1 hypothetical protein CkaCkLH20_05412 [Colletotrichum karsti]